MKDRFLGCIVGGAIGDALGGPFEGRVGPVVADLDGGRLISDDTQLTLATCEAIESDGITPERLAERLLAWHRQRRFRGLGASTLKALRDLEAGAHWALAGRTGEHAAGNGAAMRAAPLAFCLDPQSAADRLLLSDLARVTHRHDEAYVGARAIVDAIRIVTSGDWAPGQSLVQRVTECLPDTRVRDALAAAVALPIEASILEASRELGCSGFVAESVPLALFAAQQVAERGLNGVVRGVIEAGGDTDTIAAMAGQVAGAWLGFERLPANLVAQVEGLDQVLAIARATANRLFGES